MTQLIDPSIWAEARIAYLSGATALEVCARFGLGRSAFYNRAASEGWRRSDQAPCTLDDLDEAAPEVVRAAVDLAEDAMARATRAIGRGRLREARGWTRLAIELRQMAKEDADGVTWNQAVAAACEREAAFHARWADRETAGPDSPDGSPAEVSALTHSPEMKISDPPDSVDYFQTFEQALAALGIDAPKRISPK